MPFIRAVFPPCTGRIVAPERACSGPYYRAFQLHIRDQKGSHTAWKTTGSFAELPRIRRRSGSFFCAECSTFFCDIQAAFLDFGRGISTFLAGSRRLRQAQNTPGRVPESGGQRGGFEPWTGCDFRRFPGAEMVMKVPVSRGSQACISPPGRWFSLPSHTEIWCRTGSGSGRAFGRNPAMVCLLIRAFWMHFSGACWIVSGPV